MKNLLSDWRFLSYNAGILRFCKLMYVNLWGIYFRIIINIWNPIKFYVHLRKGISWTISLRPFTYYEVSAKKKSERIMNVWSLNLISLKTNSRVNSRTNKESPRTQILFVSISNRKGNFRMNKEYPRPMLFVSISNRRVNLGRIKNIRGSYNLLSFQVRELIPDE